jgi:hypothetical protein
VLVPVSVVIGASVAASVVEPESWRRRTDSLAVLSIELGSTSTLQAPISAMQLASATRMLAFISKSPFDRPRRRVRTLDDSVALRTVLNARDEVNATPRSNRDVRPIEW